MKRRWMKRRPSRGLPLLGALVLASASAAVAAEGERTQQAPEQPVLEQQVLELDEPVPDDQLATGPVQSVDASAGVLQVRGEAFQAHPGQLEDLEPGQMVSVIYAEEGERRWVQELRVGAPAEQVRRDREQRRQQAGGEAP